MDKIVRHDLAKVVLLLLALVLLWRVRFVLIILLISFILTVILVPFVQKLHKIHLPAVLAVFIPLAALVGTITTLALYVGPAVAEQVPRFVQDLPAYLEELPVVGAVNIDFQQAVNYFSNRLGSFDQIVVDVGAALVRAVLGVLTVVFITIYWLGSYANTKKTLISYVPKHLQAQATDVWRRIEEKLERWFVGQVLVSAAVGLLVWAAAHLLNLPYAGVLALIAALLEIIPNVGPVLATLPAVIIGASESLEKAFIVLLTYILIQQFENQILTPQLLSRTVKLHPIIIIISILSGGILLGIIGALFAVPTALVVSAFVDSIRGEQRVV